MRFSRLKRAKTRYCRGCKHAATAAVNVDYKTERCKSLTQSERFNSDVYPVIFSVSIVNTLFEGYLNPEKFTI